MVGRCSLFRVPCSTGIKIFPWFSILADSYSYTSRIFSCSSRCIPRWFSLPINILSTYKKCGKLGTRKDSSSLFFAIESRDLCISYSKRLRVKRRKITLQENDTSHIKNEKIEKKVSKTILQIMYSSSKLNENKEYIIVDHL